MTRAPAASDSGVEGQGDAIAAREQVAHLAREEGQVEQAELDHAAALVALGVRLRPRSGLVVRLDPERYQRRSGVKLSLLDLPFLPDEMRDLLSA